MYPNEIFVYLIIIQPIESPEVIFIGSPPEHEHIYSNGFICLSILYDGKYIMIDFVSIID